MSRPWHQTFPNDMSDFPDTLGSTVPQPPVSTVSGWYDETVIINMGNDSKRGSSVGLTERYTPVCGTRYNPKLPRWPLNPQYFYGRSASMDDHSSLHQKTAMDLARKFAENTSLGGMAYMNNSNRWWSTAFWVVIFVTGLALCMGHLYLIFQNYYEYPYSTIGEMKFDLLPFPSVTVCNRNPISVSGMEEVSQDLQEYLRNMAPAIQDPDNSGKGDGTTDPGQDDMPSNKEPDSGLSTAHPYELNIGLEAPGSSNTSQPLPGRTKRMVNRGPPPTNNDGTHSPAQFAVSSSHARRFEQYQRFLKLYGNVSLDTRQRAGHQKEVLITDCSFNGYECSYENFTHLLSPEYGNCYTFNSADYVDHPFLTRQHGRTYGLRLVLFAEIQEYPSGVTEAKGFSVSIHPFHTMPFPEVTGISVSPGFETSIGIKYLNLTKLGKPYNRCVYPNSYLNHYDYYYTQQTCQMTCHYREFVKQCGCYYAPFELYYASGVLNTSRACHSTGDYACMANVEECMKNGTCNYTCYPGCTETKYSFQYSMVAWPERSLVPHYQDRACQLSKKVCEAAGQSDEERLTVISENFGVLNVYFDELTYHDVHEERTYDEYALASDVGGTLGLWLGVSILTGVEITQFVLELIRYSCRKKRQKSLQ